MAHGIYAKLATETAHINPLRVLDIGIGTGHGLAELNSALPINPARVIVGLEENKKCLEAASDLFRGKLQEVQVTERVSHNVVGDRSFSYIYEPGTLDVPKHGINLIESDTLTDPEITNFLVEHGPWDLITIWFIGTHKARQFCEEISISGDSNYREQVQDHIFDLAPKILSDAGIIHIADRGAFEDRPETRQELREDFDRFARKKNLTVTNMQVYEGSEPSTPGRISVGSKQLNAGNVSNFVVSFCLAKWITD